MADELMPCPFCGGTELSYGGSAHSDVFIVCDNCLAHGPHTGAEQGKAPDAPLWNKRQPMNTLAKALEKEANTLEKVAARHKQDSHKIRCQGKADALRDVAKRLRGDK